MCSICLLVPTNFQAKELDPDAPAAVDEPSRLRIAEASAALAASTPHRRNVAVAESDMRVLLLGRQRAVGVCMG